MTLTRTVRGIKPLYRLAAVLFLLVTQKPYAQNLLNNGNFELGNGVGFSSLYTFIPVPTGTTNAGQYGVGTNPQPYNTASFISTGDHTSGTGNMLIVDGTNNSGNPEPVFWRVGTGGEICGLTVGQTYTFRYWIKSIFQTGIPGATVADVRIRWNNVVGQGGNGWSLLPTTGTTTAPPPGADWALVTYTIVPTNACVRIEMFDLNGSLAGNDFAIDDIELLPPPQPLALTYSITPVTCLGAANGAIAGYASGGITPYQSYTLNGPVNATNTTGVFTNLPPGTYSLSVTDAATPVANTVVVTNIVVTQPPNLTVSPAAVSICPGDNITITASGPPVSNWTANPADPSLTTPNAQSITVAPMQTTVYTATSTQTQNLNLIYNGDFSLGNVGFSTDYQYYHPTNPTGAQRAYGIVANAQSWWNTFAPCTGRGGSGNMMVVDGSTFNGGNDRVWCQTVPVQPGATYNFAYWIQSLTANNLAEIAVTINGVALGAAVFAPPTVCTWEQRTYTWNAGTATTATICIYNRTTASGGNDFALDDISFTTTSTCTLTAQATVTVSGSAAVTGFSYPTPVCAGTGNLLPTTVSGFTTGGAFSAVPAGLVINAATGEINVAASTPGTYTITYTVSPSGCNTGGSSSFVFTITNIITPVTAFSYPLPLCTNGGIVNPVLPGNFTTGGVFSAPPGVSINPATGAINLAASAPGTYTITYTLAASGCNPAATGNTTISITGAVTPVTSFSYSGPYCAGGSNATPNTVPGFTTGGTFSSTPGLAINPSTGVIDLAASTPGTYTVSYNVPATACNPAAGSTATVTINPVVVPVTGFSYAGPVCSNATNPVPVTAAGFTTGGVFSSTPGLSINPSTGVINLAASTPGTYTVTYTIAAAGCNPAGSSTASITITPVVAPVTGFSYATPVCVNGTNPVPITVPGFTTGGVYTAPAGVAINSATGVINLAASTPGTYTIIYTVPATGCNPMGSSAASITITPSVTPVTGFAYPSPVCTNDPNPAPVVVSGFTPGGTFSSTPGLSLNPSSGVINVAASTPGTYMVTYAIAASGCNPAASSSASITINAATVPVTAFSYNSPVCLNSTNPVPLPAAGFVTGGTFSGSPGLSVNATTGVIDLANSQPGTHTVTYTVPAANCRVGASSTATIVLRPVPAAPTVQTPVMYCQNAATVPLSATGSGLLWYATAGGGTGTATAPRPPSATPGNQSYYVSQTVNGCESPRALIEVVIHPLPLANAGPDKQVRAGQSVQLDGSASGNNITILWTPQQYINNPTALTPLVNPPSSIRYTLNVTSANGCVARDEVRVTVLQDLIVPNVFSPNGDNINDQWIIKFIEQYPNNRVQIFNRYGQLLFETRGYSSSNAWDGTHKGKPLPVGAYYYIIQTQEGQEPLRGSVSIIR
ncbi:MAG: gliding motility-associated C-terminal domain-containing protein [Lacibacter sp.]